MTQNQETDGERIRDRPRGYGEPPSVAPPPAVASARRTTATLVGAAAVLAGAVAALLSVAVFDEGASTNAVVAVVASVLALLAAAVLGRAVLVLRGNQSTLAAREADALRMAELDELTGLGNYRMFTRQLSAEVARSRRHDDPFSLVLLDLDGFKAVNDELGHLAGDDALRLVADALRGALREEDVCCRQGGDEFAVIAVRAGEQEARELSERLTQAIAAIPLPGGGGRRLGAGAGWATFGRPARSADELILRADAQLRGVKRGEGRGDHAPAQPAPQSRPRGRLGRGEAARLTLLSGLSRALAGAHDERALADTTVAFLAGAFDGVGAAALAIDTLDRPRLVALSSRAHDGAAAALAAHDAVERAVAASSADGRAVATAMIADELDIDWLDGTHVRCELAVAVRGEGRCWGTLVLASDRLHAYGDAERTLAEAIAEQLGRALAARRLFDRLRGAGFGELYRVAGDGDGPAEDEGEQWRVADLAWRVGRVLALDDADLRALYLAALFHDVGTVGVPATLLTRPGELHEEELVLVREHPLIGERMLRSLPLLREAAPIVRHEHERYDGAGYPDGLAGDAIPLTARILLACDALVAITSPRPWRAARPLDAARTELRRVAGAQLDPRVVDALLEVVEGAPDEDVELSRSSSMPNAVDWEFR